MNLSNQKFLGKVISVDDTDFEGKIKVRITGIWDNLKDDELPYVICNNFITSSSSSGSGFFQLPKLNSLVEIEFENGDQYCGKWNFISQISNELWELIGNDNDYKSAISLLFDVESNVFLYWTQKDGLVIRTKNKNENFKGIQLDNKDKIEIIDTQKNRLTLIETGLIELKDKNNNGLKIENKIEIGKEKFEEALLGQKFLDFVDTLVNELGKISGFATPSGAAGTLNSSPMWSVFSQKMKSNAKKVLSKKVYIE